jgi:hypothetical protein
MLCDLMPPEIVVVARRACLLDFGDSLEFRQ